MVGLVVVSHSQKIAEGVCELAAQICQNGARIIPAGGLADGTLGTDAARIAEAVRSADSGDGVLILCDIGSSILSSDLALELLGDGAHAEIADAPLVEGAIAAAAEAGCGSALPEVKEAAEEAGHIPKR